MAFLRDGDNKCNSVCYRGATGLTGFFSLMAALISLVVLMRPCCGPQWSWIDGTTSPFGADESHLIRDPNAQEEVSPADQAAQFRRLARAPRLGDFVRDEDHCQGFLGVSDESVQTVTLECYQRNLWVIVCFVLSMIMLTISLATCCVGGALQEKNPDLVEEIRQYSEAQRVREYMRRAQDKAYGAKLQKKKLSKKNKEGMEMDKMSDASSMASGMTQATMFGQPVGQFVQSPYSHTVYATPASGVRASAPARSSMLYRVV